MTSNSVRICWRLFTAGLCKQISCTSHSRKNLAFRSSNSKPLAQIFP